MLGGRELPGSIDEVALYNTTLTTQQVQTLYNASFTPSTGATAPEPGSIALLLTGLPLAGTLIARRRKK